VKEKAQRGGTPAGEGSSGLIAKNGAVNSRELGGYLKERLGEKQGKD